MNIAVIGVSREAVMAIITISRELAALGDETAQELAKAMQYRFVNKHSLENRMKSYGVAGRKLENYDERKPSFWASLSQDRDDYLHYLKTAMLTEAAGGNCIFIGRGANAVFRAVPGVVSIFLAAPLDIRLERVKSYFHCDERRARQIIDQSDHDRAGFHRYFFDTDWKDPANYQLCLNTGAVSPPECALMVKQLADRFQSGEETPRIQELLLAQKVARHILYEKGIGIHFLEVAVSGTGVELFGIARSQALLEAAAAAAAEVPAVSSVKPAMQVAHDYSLIP
ncbi:MAG: cytidylate kinase-like family protein [Treponema sp.]|nr:cytidylate kinase-like family protein [Treponema sp.]